MLQDLQIMEGTNPYYYYHSKVFSRQQRFNYIFTQLRIKNSQNQKYIKQYIKKMDKRHHYLSKISRRQSFSQRIPSTPQISRNFSLSQSKIKNLTGASQLHDQKDCETKRNSLLKETNNTNSKYPYLLTPKRCLLGGVNKNSIQQQEEQQYKQKSLNIKLRKNHCKSSFFKEITPGHRCCNKNFKLSKLDNQKISNKEQPYSHSHHKCPLSIKILIFEQQKLISTQTPIFQNYKQKSARIATQLNKQSESYKMDKSNQLLFHDSNFTNQKRLSSIKPIYTKDFKEKLRKMYQPKSHRAISGKFIKPINENFLATAEIFHQAGFKFRINETKSLLK